MLLWKLGNLLNCLSLVLIYFILKNDVFFTLVLKEISINPYMETSVCYSYNDIKVCKYGKSSCHGDCVF